MYILEQLECKIGFCVGICCIPYYSNIPLWLLYRSCTEALETLLFPPNIGRRQDEGTCSCTAHAHSAYPVQQYSTGVMIVISCK